MIWKSKPRTRTPDPRAGDRRTVRRFAIVPTRLDDGFTVWLGPYVVDQVYCDPWFESSFWSDERSRIPAETTTPPRGCSGAAS